MLGALLEGVPLLRCVWSIALARQPFALISTRAGIVRPRIWALAFALFALMECLLAEEFSLDDKETHDPPAFIANAQTVLATSL